MTLNHEAKTWSEWAEGKARSVTYQSESQSCGASRRLRLATAETSNKRLFEACQFLCLASLPRLQATG